MAEQPGAEGGASGEPARPGSHGGEPARDPRLAEFAPGGAWDACPPSGALAAVLEEVSGPEWRCPGATDGELAVLVHRWAAIESWAAAGKLGVIRQMIRADQDVPWQVPRHGDLPDTYSGSVHHELALALAMPAQSAERQAWLAWELQARLPGIGALLSGGVLTQPKARAIAEEFQNLSDAHAAQAEKLILAQLPGKTHGQAMRLAARAACEADPDGTAQRREHAQREHARIRLWREQTGAAALAGYGLPADEALAAHANVTARAAEYKASKAFGDARMDEIRVLAYLDLLNEIPAAARIAHARARAADETGPGNDDPADTRPPESKPGKAERGDDDPGDDGPGNSDPGDGGPGGPGPGDGDGDAGDGTPGGGAAAGAISPARQDLVIPLVTLLGLGKRPGEGHGLGPLDPALARALADAAAASPGSQLCVTVTSPQGYAIGHGCAKPDRAGQAPQAAGQSPAGLRLTEFPARVNLTIPQTILEQLPGPATRGWSLTPRAGPRRTPDTGPAGGTTGPAGGYGTWTLTPPGGRELTVRLEPVPTLDCDHRHESHAYQPNDKLRHLVQVRDGDCTFPSCSRHARESDFEHALPYHKGGRTCGCNAGARSRRWLSRPGARFRDCSRAVSPGRSPNPPCASRRSGLSVAAAVRLFQRESRGLGSCCGGSGTG